MKRGSFTMLLVVVIILGGIIGGAFLGGVAIGKSKGKEASSQQARSQLGQAASRFGQANTSPTTPTVTNEATAVPQGTNAAPATPQGASQSGLTPGEQQETGQGATFPGGATTGTVEKVEGNRVTVITAQGTVTVVVGDNTSIQKTVTGKLSDISTGQIVSVSGNQQNDGSISATAISLVQFASQPGGTAQPGSQLPRGAGLGGLLGRGAMVGTVEKIEGNILTVTTAQGSAHVLVADSTSIEKTVQGSVGDMSVGVSIRAFGQRNNDGSINAVTISIVPALQSSGGGR